MQLTPRDKRILQIAGVVLPLLLLVYFFVLRPDDGEDVALPEFPSGPTGLTGAPSESPSVTPSPTPRETLPPVSLAGARDPFSIPPGLELTTGGGVGPTTSPARTTTAPGGTVTVPGGTVTSTIPGTTSTATVPGTTTTVPGGTTTTTRPPPPDEKPGNKILIGGHDVKLVEVAGNGKRVDVRVDGKLYIVEPGAIFDDNFRLVRIDGRCAKFLFGDQSFELCEKA